MAAQGRPIGSMAGGATALEAAAALHRGPAMTVTAEHQRQYREEGCTRVEGVLSPDEVDAVLSAIDRERAAFEQDPEGYRARTAANAGNRTLNPPAVEGAGGGLQMRNFLWHVPEFAWLATESPVGRVVGEVTSADHVRPWIDATFIKEGGSPAAATPWHNDVCTFAFTGDMLPSLWVALTDVDEENAPMITLAGSNQDPWRYHSPLSPQDVERPPGYRPWSELIERCNAPDADVRVWPARAGDILLIHPKTMHASRPRGPGAKSGRRVAFTLRWIGSDVVWAPDALSILPKPLVDSGLMRRGEPAPEALFPVVWRREHAAGA